MPPEAAVPDELGESLHRSYVAALEVLLGMPGNRARLHGDVGVKEQQKVVARMRAAEIALAPDALIACEVDGIVEAAAALDLLALLALAAVDDNHLARAVVALAVLVHGAQHLLEELRTVPSGDNYGDAYVGQVAHAPSTSLK